MILLHDLTGMLVNHLLLQSVAGPGIDLMKMRCFRLGRSRIEAIGQVTIAS
jgi:hypothetical protein